MYSGIQKLLNLILWNASENVRKPIYYVTEGRGDGLLDINFNNEKDTVTKNLILRI
jgi:hypothetical protein